MHTMFYGLLAVAAIAVATPASAQLRIETPVGGVRVGSDRHYDRDRDYDRSSNQGTAGYIRQASQQVTGFADTIRQRDMRELAGEVQAFARNVGDNAARKGT